MGRPEGMPLSDCSSIRLLQAGYWPAIGIPADRVCSFFALMFPSFAVAAVLWRFHIYFHRSHPSTDRLSSGSFHLWDRSAHLPWGRCSLKDFLRALLHSPSTE